MTERICGKCGRKEKSNEHFDFHSRVVTPTHLCPECEQEWQIFREENLVGKPDSEWKRGFNRFLIGKEVVEFT
jgi:hypothetical protein